MGGPSKSKGAWPNVNKGRLVVEQYKAIEKVEELLEKPDKLFENVGGPS